MKVRAGSRHYSPFVATPAAVWAAAATVVWGADSDRRAQAGPADAEPEVRGAIPIFLGLAVTSVILGLILWMLLLGIEASMGSLSGPSYALAFWMGVGMSMVAGIVIGSETIVARARIGDFVSVRGFGRILPILVVPETAVIFYLILAFLALGRLGEAAFITETQADVLVQALLVYALTTLAVPAGAVLSNRVRELSSSQGYLRAVYVATAGLAPTYVGLLFAFLQIGSA